MCLKVLVHYKRGDLYVCKKWLHKIMVVTPCSQLLIWKHQFCSRKSLEWWQFAAQKLFTLGESEDSPGLVGRGYEKGEMTIISYVNVVKRSATCSAEVFDICLTDSSNCSCLDTKREKFISLSWRKINANPKFCNKEMKNYNLKK